MTEQSPKRVFIIGGGPAASATAISLVNCLKPQEMKNTSVVQVTGLSQRGEVIGETVPPAAAACLRQLQVSNLEYEHKHLSCPGSTSVWGQDEVGFNDFFYTPIGQGYHLNRSVFNADLIYHAQARGVTVMTETKLTQVSSVNSGLLLQLETPKGRVQQSVDFVVDATGIQAKVARSLGVARNQYDAVISVCHVVKLKTTPKKAAHTLVAAVENGWWYGTQLPGNKALLSFCTDRQSLKKHQVNKPANWHKMLTKSGWFYRSCCDQFGADIPIPAQTDIRVAPSAILSCVVGENWLAVGDAACSYDSMTSAGITKALQQGLEAGKAMAHLFQQHSHNALKNYQKSVFHGFNQYLRLHQQLYGCEQRFPDSGFWQRRQFTA